MGGLVSQEGWGLYLARGLGVVLTPRTQHPNNWVFCGRGGGAENVDPKW